MKSRILGRTGLRVSEIGFGCWAIGGNAYGKVRDEDSLGALETAWDGGVNFYDTADTYGEGHSERLLGKFLSGKPRDKFILATKVGWDFYPLQGPSDPSGRLNHAGHRKNFDPGYIRFACAQSLKRLGIETIDLYQLHNPSLELIRKGETVRVLEELKREGKIRFIGISVHTEEEALAAIEDGRFDSLQVIFNLMDQRMAARVFSEAVRTNTGIIIREPLASGLLTGKYGPGHEFPKDDHRRRWVREKREADWEKIQCLQSALAGQKISLPQAALEYPLTFDAVSAIIPGAKTQKQVLENLNASLRPGLGPEAAAAIKKVYMENEIFRKALNPR
jgi:aryl-alcohol dehydrogenase-like predicted oxidoreductase